MGRSFAQQGYRRRQVHGDQFVSCALSSRWADEDGPIQRVKLLGGGVKAEYALAVLANDDPDALSLHPKLASVFDVLRHQNTRAPMAIAIYGDWGTGKSSASLGASHVARAVA